MTSHHGHAIYSLPTVCAFVMSDPNPENSSESAPRGALAGFQRKFLRGKAHPLRPVVQVGDAGITDGVIAAAAEALAIHELIKVRLHEPEDKKASAAELATRTGSEMCGIVGHTVILYRPDPDDPKIELPTR